MKKYTNIYPTLIVYMRARKCEGKEIYKDPHTQTLVKRQ